MNSWLRRHLTRRRKDDKKEKSAKQEGERMNTKKNCRSFRPAARNCASARSSPTRAASGTTAGMRTLILNCCILPRAAAGLMFPDSGSAPGFWIRSSIPRAGSIRSRPALPGSGRSSVCGSSCRSCSWKNRSRSGIMIICSEGCFPISTARPAGRMRRSMCWNMA